MGELSPDRHIPGSRKRPVDCVRDDVPVPAEGVSVYEGTTVNAAVTGWRAFAVMSVAFVAPVISPDQPVSVQPDAWVRVRLTVVTVEG